MIFLSARKCSIIGIITKTARFGKAYTEKQYQALMDAAKAA
jgi:hypothetical protein